MDLVSLNYCFKKLETVLFVTFIYNFFCNLYIHFLLIKHTKLFFVLFCLIFDSTHTFSSNCFNPELFFLCFLFVLAFEFKTTTSFFCLFFDIIKGRNHFTTNLVRARCSDQSH